MYYAVKIGRTPGIYESWSECQKEISGYPSASFKRFETREEAVAFIEEKNIWKEQIEQDVTSGYIVAFVDGSFSELLNRYSYGVLIIDDKFSEYSLCGFSENPRYLSAKNIAGEVLAAINAMDWCVSNNFDKIKIYHDYDGISKWVLGEWEAKSDISKMYISIYKEKYGGIITTDYQKISRYNNNPYNDKVYALAKTALEDKKRVAIEGDHWFTIPYYQQADFDAIIDLVKEVDGNINVSKDVAGFRQFYRFEQAGAKLTVTYFLTGDHKILVQGRPSLLFQIIITIIIELDDTKLDRILASAYRQTIDTRRIDDTFSVIIPYFPVAYPENIKKFIRQSIINLYYYAESEDYTHYAFPALRALEGHIKYLIQLGGGTPGISFTGFNRMGSGPYYYSGPLANTTLKDSIEKCYNYYKSQRDTAFHYGIIAGVSDSTRTISTKPEADEIIKHCIQLISENMN